MKKIVLSKELFDMDDEASAVDCTERHIQFGGELGDQEGLAEPDYFDLSWEARKSNALLYLHMHRELTSNAKFKATYDMLRNEMVRTTAYWMEHCAIVGEISEEERASTHFALDAQISLLDHDTIESFRDDAIYVANLYFQ